MGATQPTTTGRARIWLLGLFLLPCFSACRGEPDAGIAPSSAADVAQYPGTDAGADSARAAIAVQIVADRPALDSTNRFPVDFGGNTVIDTENGRPVRRLLVVPGSDTRPHQVTKTAYDLAPSGLLVLYDTTSTYGWLGELHAMAAQTLLSHFATVTSAPVAQYTAGDLAKYQGVLYIGSSYDEPLPVAFLDDVLAAQTPVVWIYDNIWQLVKRAENFTAAYGYSVSWFDISAIDTVLYKNAKLTRDPTNGSGLVEVNAPDPAIVTTLATAMRADGSTLPWAVRSKQLIFVSENPFSYIGPDDRLLAFCDLLFEAFAPQTPARHRALLRLEDVNASHSPKELRAIVDYLASEHVPFSMALIPLYVDAQGVFNQDVPLTLHWKDRPAMLSAVKYATSRGGRIIMHGYTHQFGDIKDPYSGVSADDFEFFLTHIDDQDNVVYDGGVPGDSTEWAIARIKAGLAEIQESGLQTPVTFEYPHYAGTSVDSKAIKTLLGKAYHRGLYFGGDLGLTAPNPAHSIGMFYPFSVTDPYGWKIIPENLGNFEPKIYNNHPPRLASDLIASAKNNLVIRDGVASLFFHPYYPLAELKKIVAGIKALGYTFVAGDSL
jgi:uncharacterized protein YdaL